MIVEDELELAKNIQEILEILNYEVVGIFPSAVKVMSYLSTHEVPDLILMDILIEGDLDGIDLTYLIKDKFKVPIVFLTAYSDREILERITKTVFEGYLLKPFTAERLEASIYLALKDFDSKKDKKQKSPTLKVRDKGYLVPVPEDDIIFLEADGLYTKVYTRNKQYMMRDILKDIGSELSQEKFLRVHKSYIINIQQIESINSKEISIAKHAVPIRRGFYKELRKIMEI